MTCSWKCTYIRNLLQQGEIADGCCSADPESKNFGKHWSMEEIHDMFAPSQDSVDSVRSWLEKVGVEAHRISQSANKQWMQMDLSTAEAEKLFQTKYHFFEHAPSGKSTIGCDEYVNEA